MNISNEQVNYCGTNFFLGLKKAVYFVGVPLLFVFLQTLWLSNLIAPKIGMINILPNCIYVFFWFYFYHTFYSNFFVKWIGFFLAFCLTLRLPISISNSLESINWLMVITVGIFIFIPIGRYFLTKRRAIILIITTVIILFNSYTHLWLNSPFTYAFRLVNHLESSYVGKDNNSTWECPYEKPVIVVQCDMRHFIASEKIFTEPKYDSSFSVFLRRFFYGYISSLVGFENNRWFSGFCLNIVAWLISCVCIFRSCILLNLKEEIAESAMMAGASAWGFVSFVAQPAPYLLAYALAVIVPTSILEIVNKPFYNSVRFMFLVSVYLVSLSVYDIYPVIIASILILLFCKLYRLAIILPLIQLLISIGWSRLSLLRLIGTQGDPRNSQVISKSFDQWISALSNYDFVSIVNYAKNGSLSFFIAGFGLGVLVLAYFLKILLLDHDRLRIWNDTNNAGDSRKIIFIYFLGLSFLVLLSSIFLAPEAIYWNPSFGLLPRFNFYYYGVVIISTACVLYNFDKRLIYVLPTICFILPLLDLNGIATIPLMFDYGEFRLVWK